MPSGDLPLGEPTHTGTSPTTKTDNYNPPPTQPFFHPTFHSHKEQETIKASSLKQGCKKRFE
jgi:hypothetical protein